MPPIKTIGRNTAASVIVVDITAKYISLEPLKAACIGVIPSSTFLYQMKMNSTVFVAKGV